MAALISLFSLSMIPAGVFLGAPIRRHFEAVSNYSHVVTAEGAQKLVFCAGQVRG
jgi:hypothetical protein